MSDIRTVFRFLADERKRRRRWALQSCDCCGICGEPSCNCAEELNGDTSEPLGDSFETLGLSQDDFQGWGIFGAGSGYDWMAGEPWVTGWMPL